MSIQTKMAIDNVILKPISTYGAKWRQYTTKKKLAN